MTAATRTFALAIVAALLAIPAGAAAQGLGLPGPGGCFEDRLEPNGYLAPTPLTESVFLEDVNICASDDWYRIDLVPGQVIEIELDFIHAAGDIDATLHDAEYARIDISEGSSNIERLQYVAHEPATLYLRVYGYGGAANDYTLDFVLDDYSVSCPELRSPNLELDTFVSGRICLGRTVEWRIDAERGRPFEVTLAVKASVGDLDVQVHDEDGRRIAISASRGQWERLRVFPTRNETMRLVVAGYGDGFGRFDLGLIGIPRRPDPISVRGTLVYDRLVVNERGLKGLTTVRPEGLLVEVIRAMDEFPVARTTTDAEGHFSLDVEYAYPQQLQLRVSARLEAPAYRMRVVPRIGAVVAHHLQSETLDRYPIDDDGVLRLDLGLTAGLPVVGAFNIAAVARRGFEAVTSVRPDADLDLTLVWDRGQAHPCGSCYSSGDILLAGGQRDTDEFDDVVILHELGHFIIDHLSWDDSPGGSHDGSRTSPLVAFGEGLATAFALLVVGEPLYADSGRSGLRAYEDLEGVPYPAAYGTADGELSGRVSEWTTAALLWDLTDDSGNDEPFDRVAVGQLAMFRFLFDHLLDRRRPDVGAAGMELADFLNAFRCTHRGIANRIEQLAWGHQRYPIQRVGKAKCEWSPMY